MNLKLIPALGFLVILLALGVIFKPWSPAEREPNPEPDPEGVHYHAGFQVYVDNELQDFSDLKYMNTQPCGTHEEEHATPEEEQMEKAHLHDNIGDVVHVHRPAAAWRDLFTNMGYEIDDTNLELYVNGDKVEYVQSKNLLDHSITPYESVIFFVGENDDIAGKLAGAVTREHIEQTEQRSENCGV